MDVTISPPGQVDRLITIVTSHGNAQGDGDILFTTRELVRGQNFSEGFLRGGTGITIDTDGTINATVVNDTDIAIFAGQGLNGGGVFSTNQEDSETIIINLDDDNLANISRAGNTITVTRADNDTFTFDVGSGGSVNPSQAQLSVRLSASDTELSTSANTKTVTVTLSANSGFTLSNGSVSVRDQHNASIPVSGSGTSFTFTVDRTIVGSLQVTGHATLTRTSDSTAYQESRNATFHVNRGWYSAFVATAPANVAAMTDQGVWRTSGTLPSQQQQRAPGKLISPYRPGLLDTGLPQEL